MLVEKLTWQEYEEEIEKRIVILPLGALEQHGPHLPLNVDVVIPRSLALMVDEDKIVDEESARKVPYLIFPPPDDIITRSGSFYRATYSSREKGELLARSITGRIVEIANQEFE